MLTLKQWLAIAGLIVLGATHWLAYDYGGKSDASGALRAANRVLAQHKADAEQARQEAAKANKELRDALKRPIAQEVADAVKDNPSDCRLPGPVVERVRDAIREANAAE